MIDTLDQCKYKSKRKMTPRDNDSVEHSPRDLAIAEARRRIADLRFSIRDFQKRKARGDKWLGAS
jgi:hypothetical protein